MKLLRYREGTTIKPGILDSKGVIRDLSGQVGDFSGGELDPDRLAELARVNLVDLPAAPSSATLASPVGQVEKFMCIGLNYADHAKETGGVVAPEPILFLKASSAICGPNDDIIKPHGSTKLDYEVELGIVIGRKAKHVSETDAKHHIAGYCVVNDVSERVFQLERSGQWTKGKSCDHFGPLGPWLVTTDEITSPNALDIWLEIDGERRQWSNTRQMVFSCDYILSYLSSLMTLHPGDVIATGTPPGVAMGMNPPRYLQAGQEVRLGVAGLGEQRAFVRDEG